MGAAGSLLETSLVEEKVSLDTSAHAPRAVGAWLSVSDSDSESCMASAAANNLLQER